MKWLLLALAAVPAFGQGIPFNANGMVHAQGGASYVGALEVTGFGTNVVAYGGLWAPTAAARGSAVINLCDSAGNNCADMVTDATTGHVVITTRGADACATADDCVVATVYDTSGTTNCTTACDYTQATNALRPTIKHNCFATGIYCMVFTPTQWLQSPNLLAGAVAQPFSLSGVAERSGAFTTFGDFFGSSGDDVQFGFTSSTNTAFLYAGSVGTATAADSAPHAIQGLGNGASSSVYIDGSSSSISAGTNSIATALRLGGNANKFTGYLGESGVWSADKSANFSAMNSNQHSRNGF